MTGKETRNSRHKGYVVVGRELPMGARSVERPLIVGGRGLWGTHVNSERAADEHIPGKSSRTPGRGRPERERKVEGQFRLVSSKWESKVAY